MRMLVETTGSFTLLDPSGHTIHHNRPTVVDNTGFVGQRISIRQLRIVSDQIPDHVTDEDFETFVKEQTKDKKKSVADATKAFLAKVAPKPEPVKDDPPKKD